MTRRRTPRAVDRGFTLIEMIITVTLLGIVSTAVGAALFVGIRATTGNHVRIDQSMTSMAITRFLSPDIYAAEGPVIVNSASDTTCGGVAPLKLKSRSAASGSTTDTTVVWALSGTDLVRRTCVNGTQTDSFIVATGVNGFAPTACAAPCTSRTISVTFTAAADAKVPAQSWTLTMSRRGGTS